MQEDGLFFIYYVVYKLLEDKISVSPNIKKNDKYLWKWTATCPDSIITWCTLHYPAVPYKNIQLYNFFQN